MILGKLKEINYMQPSIKYERKWWKATEKLCKQHICQENVLWRLMRWTWHRKEQDSTKIKLSESYPSFIIGSHIYNLRVSSIVFTQHSKISFFAWRWTWWLKVCFGKKSNQAMMGGLWRLEDAAAGFLVRERCTLCCLSLRECVSMWKTMFPKTDLFIQMV